MALNPINPALRRFVNDSNDIVRVELRVAPGTELEVDEAVAAQLPSAFKDPEYVSKRDKKRAYAKAADALLTPAEASAAEGESEG